MDPPRIIRPRQVKVILVPQSAGPWFPRGGSASAVQPATSTVSTITDSTAAAAASTPTPGQGQSSDTAQTQLPPGVATIGNVLQFPSVNKNLVQVPVTSPAPIPHPNTNFAVFPTDSVYNYGTGAAPMTGTTSSSGSQIFGTLPVALMNTNAAVPMTSASPVVPMTPSPINYYTICNFPKMRAQQQQPKPIQVCAQGQGQGGVSQNQPIFRFLLPQGGSLPVQVFPRAQPAPAPAPVVFVQPARFQFQSQLRQPQLQRPNVLQSSTSIPRAQGQVQGQFTLSQPHATSTAAPATETSSKSTKKLAPVPFLEAPEVTPTTSSPSPNIVAPAPPPPLESSAPSTMSTASSLSTPPVPQPQPNRPPMLKLTPSKVAYIQKVRFIFRYRPFVKAQFQKAVQKRDAKMVQYLKRLLEVIEMLSKTRDAKNQFPMDTLDKLIGAVKKLLKIEMDAQAVKAKEVPPPPQTSHSNNQQPPLAPKPEEMCPFQTMQEAISKSMEQNGGNVLPIKSVYFQEFSEIMETLTKTGNEPEMEIVSESPLMEEPKLPNVFQKELRLLNPGRFKVDILKLPGFKATGFVIQATLTAPGSPAVPPLKIFIPRGYPDESPTLVDLNLDTEKGFGGIPPMFKKITDTMKSRLLKMPKFFTVMQILGCWEMTVRQICGDRPRLDDYYYEDDQFNHATLAFL